MSDKGRGGGGEWGWDKTNCSNIKKHKPHSFDLDG